MLDQLAALHESLPEGARRERVAATMAELERRLYLYESGPTGDGPSTAVMANSTGCSSVYASTVPFSPYLNPWVNGLFQDAQPLAMGMYEGLVSRLVGEVKALRVARSSWMAPTIRRRTTRRSPRSPGVTSPRPSGPWCRSC